ncbi:MAG: LysR substrate-binding domain-containing protein [Bryobacteraceae bacterium]|nr:LysR substrate-binding domain-containing protein [Bryobacteraceae bacterium]
MTLQELRYFVSVADHRHFGRAAEACRISQPTLSGQLRKLEEHLGVTLFERTNKRVSLTPAGERILVHARRALEDTAMMESEAAASRDQLAGPLKLGVIPTLAPYLMPLILGPLRKACPAMKVELWEDLTNPLLDLLRGQKLDAALIATEAAGSGITTTALFEEPFLAALPASHRLAKLRVVDETELAPDVLVLADGHCLAGQTLSACSRADRQRPFQAASLETLVNLVAEGYGTTLIPRLAAAALGRRSLVLRPLRHRASRTVRLASRPAFPRPQALKAVEKVIRGAIPENFFA